MTCFRIDESGYTGFDLLNADQRFQGASAIAIDNDDAGRLIKEHFPRLQAPELKYSALSRRASNHPRLVGLMKDLLSDFDCVTYVADKRFMLTLMFVDYAVEPYYYERGIDLYENGQNYAMASMLHMAGPTLLGETEFAALLDAFQQAMKEKNRNRSRNWLSGPRHQLGRSGSSGSARTICRSRLPFAITTPGVSTDIAIVVLISLITRMEVMARGPIGLSMISPRTFQLITTYCNGTSITTKRWNSALLKSHRYGFHSSSMRSRKWTRNRVPRSNSPML